MIDPDSIDDVMEVLEKINSLGTTVVMATHDQDIVNAMKKRVIRIEKGQIISDKKGGKYRA
jgi:cell division transport system ATP-binding protein